MRIHVQETPPIPLRAPAAGLKQSQGLLDLGVIRSQVFEQLNLFIELNDSHPILRAQFIEKAAGSAGVRSGPAVCVPPAAANGALLTFVKP